MVCGWNKTGVAHSMDLSKHPIGSGSHYQTSSVQVALFAIHMLYNCWAKWDEKTLLSRQSLVKLGKKMTQTRE